MKFFCYFCNEYCRGVGVRAGISSTTLEKVCKTIFYIFIFIECFRKHYIYIMKCFVIFNRHIKSFYNQYNNKLWSGLCPKVLRVPKCAQGCEISNYKKKLPLPSPSDPKFE